MLTPRGPKQGPLYSSKNSGHFCHLRLHNRRLSIYSVVSVKKERRGWEIYYGLSIALGPEGNTKPHELMVVRRHHLWFQQEVTII